MEALIKTLARDFPELIFIPGNMAAWSPSTRQVSYTRDETPEAIWSILHEIGHAVLGHANYANDLNLLQKEIEAWESAKEISLRYQLTISDDHIEACLDSYRDWLYKRSTCPNCFNHGYQPSKDVYSCLNCNNAWRVSSSRMCRPYRLKIADSIIKDP